MFFTVCHAVVTDSKHLFDRNKIKRTTTMKTMKLNKTILGLASIAFLFQACSNNDEKIDCTLFYPNALVTVKRTTDNTVYLQLDDKTTLYPTNLKSSIFGGKEMRALTNFTITDVNSNGYDKTVHINWIDSILTKPSVLSFETEEENTKKYGSDAIEIVKDWVTIAEDGYLTLRFRTVWGTSHTTHHVNLLTGVNSENPYEIEFRHNAQGDTIGKPGDALVAFNLNDLPDTEGKNVKLKLKWQSFSGPKSTEFEFCSRKTTQTSTIYNNDSQFVKTIQ